MRLKKRKSTGAVGASITQLRASGEPIAGLMGQVSFGGREAMLYRSIRQKIPILDAAVGKLCRLTGGFTVACPDPAAQRALEEFFRRVPVGRGQVGIDQFLGGFLDSLLTYGRAVGEMVVGEGGLEAVLWGDVTKLEIQQGTSPLEIMFYGPDQAGRIVQIPRQELLLFSTLHAEAGSPYGVSLFRSMPFLADILMKIYETVGRNWERAGNVQYAVVCRPGSEGLDQTAAQERSQLIAEQWSHAMTETRDGTVRDFVAVGDVEIKVIGADGQILSSEVPVKQLLEQLVARTGLPPFLLGLSWSSTERMSQQQADMLTSELWAIRRAVTPILEKIAETFLRFQGYAPEAAIKWDDICLHDTVEEAKAALYRAQAEKLIKESNNEH